MFYARCLYASTTVERCYTLLRTRGTEFTAGSHGWLEAACRVSNRFTNFQLAVAGFGCVVLVHSASVAYFLGPGKTLGLAAQAVALCTVGKFAVVFITSLPRKVALHAVIPLSLSCSKLHKCTLPLLPPPDVREHVQYTSNACTQAEQASIFSCLLQHKV